MFDIVKWKEQLVGQDGKPLPGSTNIVLRRITLLIAALAFLLGIVNGLLLMKIWLQ